MIMYFVETEETRSEPEDILCEMFLEEHEARQAAEDSNGIVRQVHFCGNYDKLMGRITECK